MGNPQEQDTLLWHATFNAIIDGVALIDLEGHILQCNTAMARMLGLQEDEVVGRRCFELVHGTDAPLPDCPLVRIQESRRRETLEVAWKDRWLRVSVDPLFDGAGRLTGGVHIISDITESRRVEETLRGEDSFRRSIITRAAEGLCVCHEIPDFPFVEFTVWNDRMKEITGYTMEEINRLGWYQSMYPDPEVQKRAAERMGRMRQGEDLLAEEWVITRAGGGKRTVQISTSLLQSADGQAHVLALMQDVTAHRSAEALVRLERDLALALAATSSLEEGLRICLDAALEASGMDSGGIYLVDSAGRSLDLAVPKGLSEEFVRTVLRYEAGAPNFELVMKGCTISLEGAAFEKGLGKRAASVLRKEGLTALAVVPIAAHGRIVGCMNAASHTRREISPDGLRALEVVSAHVGNIIVRLKLEEALRESEKRFRTIFNISPAGIVLLDPQGRLVDANPSILKTMGYTLEEVRGRHVREFSLPGELPDEEVVIRETVQGKVDHWHFQKRYLRKNGEVIWVDVLAGVHRDLRGKPLFICAMCQDITEQTRMDHRLAEVAQAEQERMRRDLHDTVCQHLSGIAFVTESAREDLPKDKGAAAEGISKISWLARMALEETKDIARALRPHSDEPDVLTRYLGELATYVMDVYRVPCRVTSRRRVAVRDGHVSKQLSLIAREATLNAAKHAGAGRIRISLAEGGNHVVLRVADDGKGMPRDAGKKSGLGLQTMRNRTELIGGTLQIRSKRGKGTVVECRWRRNS